ncbi:MAG: hypothetical protein NTW12_08115 [Deltaproteobacteria bacterium]|nr:hypothetical protein [Deltaproteobacteria bacterium]
MEKTSDENSWEITANRYVAYFDIMGFKDMVARFSHNEIYEMMKKIDKGIKLTTGINWAKNPINLIKTTTYSDSIIIYSKDDSYDSLDSIISTVSALTNELLSNAIPHKGAIAFGTMTIDTVNSIFFGRPLIDAYLLQEELYFYGIVAHATIEQEIEKKKDRPVSFVMKYLCHFKNGNALHLTISPMFIFPAVPENQKMTDKLFASFDKLRFKTSGHLRKYIDNTEFYLNTVNKEYIAQSMVTPEIGQ